MMGIRYLVLGAGYWVPGIRHPAFGLNTHLLWAQAGHRCPSTEYRISNTQYRSHSIASITASWMRGRKFRIP